jgi:cell division protein FtsW
MHRIDEPSYSLLPIGLVVGAMVALIYKQPDFGTAASIVLIAVTMIFAAGLSYKYLIGGAVALVPILALFMISASYRLDRILAFLNPELDPTGVGYQARQSLISIGAGGIFGRGLTAGIQKNGFLPEPHTDFIFAVIGGELGLIGATGFLICFCVIAWRGLRIALRAPDAFGGFVALGLTTMICAQALINMSVALSLVPTKGIPLPLVSSGGSSLIVSLLGIGILLNISQHETADT